MVHGQMASEGKDVAVTQLCRWLGVPRSTVYYETRQRTHQKRVDEGLALVIREIIDLWPTFGIRRVWAVLKFGLGRIINRKAVARLMRIKGWTLRQRRQGGRPRVKVPRSVTESPDQRWSTDIAMVFCGKEGWCSFVPVIDCCTREVLGWELSLTARAKTAERALEQALLNRFGWLHGAPAGLQLRHDNGLVFSSRMYRRIVQEYGLIQEYITPYTPEENGLVERFIRSFKEEFAWQHRFQTLDEARSVIAKWVDWYNSERPHQALNYAKAKKCWESLATLGA